MERVIYFKGFDNFNFDALDEYFAKNDHIVFEFASKEPSTPERWFVGCANLLLEHPNFLKHNALISRFFPLSSYLTELAEFLVNVYHDRRNGIKTRYPHVFESDIYYKKGRFKVYFSNEEIQQILHIPQTNEIVESPKLGSVKFYDVRIIRRGSMDYLLNILSAIQNGALKNEECQFLDDYFLWDHQIFNPR